MRVEDRLGIPVVGAHVNAVLPGVHVAPRQTGRDGTIEFRDLPVRPERAVAIAPGYWLAGVQFTPGPEHELLSATIVVEPTVRLRVTVLDDTNGRPLRHANILVTHAGGDLWIWGGVLPPPDAPPRDHHDVEVRPPGR